MSEYPNWATEEMAMVMFNDDNCMNELEDVYNKGWLNEMRVNKELRQLQYVDEEVDIRFLLWETFMHFDNMHEIPVNFSVRWAEDCQPVESTSVDNRKCHAKKDRALLFYDELTMAPPGIAKSCAQLGSEIHGHLERANEHFNSFNQKLGVKEMTSDQTQGVCHKTPNQTRPLFEMVACYDGEGLSARSDEEIFNLIRNIDDLISHTGSIAKVSKKAKESIKLMEADKAALVEYVDNR